jgi:flagellar FliL protein
MTDRALDDDAEVPAAAEPAPPKSKKKLLLMIAAPVLGLAIAAGGVWASGLGASWFGHAEQVAKAPPKPAVFQELPDLLVNLNSSGRKANFLKLSISLELENKEDIPRLKAVLPRIIDNFQLYLRELRVEDLKGSAGMYRLREELLRRVNDAAAPVKVVDVLFKEMLVQ